MSSSDGTTTPCTAKSCRCSEPVKDDQGKIKLATAGAVIAAVGTCAACCLLPAIMIALGIGGSMVSSLDSLAPYKWIFVATTAGLLAYGFYSAYWKRKNACAAGASCTVCGASRQVRVALWFGTAMAVCGIIYGYLEPWLKRH